MACVYILRNVVNDKLYVGQSVDTAERRFQSHKSTLKRLQESGEKRGRNWSRLYCAMDKYGLSSFVIDKEIPCSLDKMDDLEKELIAGLKTIKIGYNVCEGGSGGNVKFRTDDFKQKVSEGVKRAWSDGKYENKKPTQFTEDGLARISKAHKGKPKSEETKRKMSESALALSEERSALMKGINNPNYGKKRPENVKEAIRKAQSNPVIVEGVSHPSQKAAAEYHKVDQHKIKDYLDGKIDKFSVTYDGVTYRSANHMSKELNVHIKTVYKLLGA